MRISKKTTFPDNSGKYEQCTYLERNTTEAEREERPQRRELNGELIGTKKEIVQRVERGREG